MPVVAGDAMADLCKTARFLDVDVDQVAGPVAFIAAPFFVVWKQ